ncbi:MAG: glycosyltransferase [Armatimonadetes bacterium]|nr:glycosyltransferase [Armatimonadota bacterium]
MASIPQAVIWYVSRNLMPMQSRTPHRSLVSVCIVTWNCRGLILECLDSLFGQPQGAQFEVIVVDNASTDGTPEAVAESFPQAQLIRNTVNRGFAAANNQALRQARGEYLFLLNPDTVLPPEALGNLVAVAEAYPQAGAIGPRLLNPDGSLQYSCRRWPSVKAALFRNTLFGRLFPGEPWTKEYLMADWPHDEVREVDWISGAAMFLRRQAVEQVGLLDEAFFWGSEDVDYCRRLWRAGWKVIYSPHPAIVHRIGGSTDQAVVRTILRRHASWYRLYAKHFGRNPLRRWVVWSLIWCRALALTASWVARYLWAVARKTLGGAKGVQG